MSHSRRLRRNVMQHLAKSDSTIQLGKRIKGGSRIIKELTISRNGRHYVLSLHSTKGYRLVRAA